MRARWHSCARCKQQLYQSQQQTGAVINCFVITESTWQPMLESEATGMLPKWKGLLSHSKSGFSSNLYSILSTGENVKLSLCGIPDFEQLCYGLNVCVPPTSVLKLRLRTGDKLKSIQMRRAMELQLSGMPHKGNSESYLTLVSTGKWGNHHPWQSRHHVCWDFSTEASQHQNCEKGIYFVYKLPSPWYLS